MDLGDFCRRAHVVIVLGKGGVGKTTVAATFAQLACRQGLDVGLVFLEDSDGPAKLFGFEGSLSYDDAVLAGDGSLRESGRVRGRLITSDAALLDYLSSHGLKQLTARLRSSGALEVVATAVPGLPTVLVLGKIRQLEQAGEYDLIVVDAPATGHALSFLSSAGGLADAARSGPLHAQAAWVAEMLTDPKRAEVIVVTIPEELPVNEAIETAFALEDRLGVALGPVVVNSCWPVLEHLEEDPRGAAASAGVNDVAPQLAERLSDAARFRLTRQRAQRAEIARLAGRLPLDRLELPYLFGGVHGPNELDRLVDAFGREVAAL
jgi:anion-transporting  ArsA/GET3 family ATPase